MNVTKNQVDDLNMTVTFTIEKEDWAEPRRKKLNEFRRTADLKGFRKGMAPISLIERIHGGAALAEVINTIISDNLHKFIEDEKIDVLGEPLPSEVEDKNDWNRPDRFTFSFDLGLAPKFEISVSSEDTIPYYNVTTSAKSVEDYKESLLKQFGQLESSDRAGGDDFIIADFEADDQKVEGAYIALRSIADEEIRKSFTGLAKGNEKDVVIAKAFANETDRAAMFKVKKEDLPALPEIWHMTVKDIKTFVNAPLTQDTFDQIFGEGVCKDEAQFDEKVKERLKDEYTRESEYRFMIDAKEYLIGKAVIDLPDAFMKRWILSANDGKYTMEEIEKEYDLFAKDFRWNMIRTRIMKDQNLKVTKEDVKKQAIMTASYQFAMYGMQNTPEDMLDNYAERILSDHEQAERMVERVEDNLVLDYVRSTATLESREISLEKMRELTK